MARTGCGWGATANAASSSSVGPRPGRLRPFLLRFVHSSFSLPLSLRRFSSSTHFLPSPFASFRSVRSLSLFLSVRSTRPRFSFTSSSFATPFFAPHHFLASPSLSLLSNQPPPFSIPPCRASKRAQLASPFRFCSVPTSTSTLVELPRRRTHTSVCAKRVSAYLGMREAWPDRGTSGGTRKLRGREVTHGGGNPPPPFPMWLLPIDFVRVRGRSNTCYRVGWKRVEGTRRGQMEEEEEDRVGVGELMASG